MTVAKASSLVRATSTTGASGAESGRKASKWARICAGLLAIALSPSCGEPPSAPEADRSAPAQAPERVVVIGPSSAETLAWLGLDEAVVGVSDYCSAPAFAALPRVGGQLDLIHGHESHRLHRQRFPPPILELIIRIGGPQETDRPFAEPATFALNKKGKIQLIELSNTPFNRADLSELLETLEWIDENDYPIRGTHS